MASVSPPAVDADGDEATLTITYTAVGDIFYPKKCHGRSAHKLGRAHKWGSTSTDEGRYEVKHMRGTDDAGGVIERPPEGRKMVARVVQGKSGGGRRDDDYVHLPC